MAQRPARRASARARTKPVAKRKNTTAACIKIDGRRLSRRVEFTPRMTDHIRHRYEDVGDSPEVISRSVGVAKATIQRLIKEQQWTRAGQGPRDLSRAEQLAMQARALARGLPPPERGRPPSEARREGVNDASFEETPFRTAAPSDLPLVGGGKEGAQPVDIEREIERLLRLVSDEVGVYENLRATLKNEPQPQREALKTAHNIASLTSTLDDLRRMRAANKEPLHHDADDDLPADIDAFRAELARRIEAFMESRTDDEFAQDMATARTGPVQS